jgi:hypothetical protein
MMNAIPRGPERATCLAAIGYHHGSTAGLSELRSGC